jgi:predicted RNase H-like HicB family nuclease
MNDVSYTISIEHEDDGYSAIAKKVIEGPSVLTYGKTAKEAVDNAYRAMLVLIAEEDKTNAS